MGVQYARGSLAKLDLGEWDSPVQPDHGLRDQHPSWFRDRRGIIIAFVSRRTVDRPCVGAVGQGSPRYMAGVGGPAAARAGWAMKQAVTPQWNQVAGTSA
ncbi:hypothetical protein CIHG_00659 [Coccidioides immitis H538.4]|uniref:Uncharacterized protein n=1 Tax=Coccidioides immitis H538.4 TaxID=396776 RepID=A0A0J8RE64_COCIT|nr:hypothetical protein CIHG_00659 [Coccidioides immitis H538.4]